MGRKNKKKRNRPHQELLGKALMVDALRRISRINGQSTEQISVNTFDTQIYRENISKSRIITDLTQKEDETPSGLPPINEEEEIGSSQRDYVDLKIDKEILNFEKKLIREISDGKSSIQKWGIGLIIASIIAAAGIMLTMQLFATQQLKDFISINFTEKFERAIKVTNTKVMHLEEEQKILKRTIENIKSPLSKMNKDRKPQQSAARDGKQHGGF